MRGGAVAHLNIQGMVVMMVSPKIRSAGPMGWSEEGCDGHAQKARKGAAIA